jgi:hypothetical protein
VTEAVSSKAPEPKLRWQEAKIAAIMQCRVNSGSASIL